MKKKIKKIKRHSESKSKPVLTFSKLKSKILACSLEKSIFSLNKFPLKMVSLLVFNFFLGIIILTYTNTMYFFFPHLICLTLNIIVTLSIGHEYANTISFLDKEILDNIQKENIELRENYKRFRQKAFHIQNLVLCIIVISIFLWGIFSQHYIKLDLVGCYAIYMVAITVSISVIGYAEYIWLLWFLYRVSNCSYMPYNKIIPAYTPFLVKIGILTKHAKWCFFIEGFLYVFEYFILIPYDNINLLSITMPNNFSFLITWAIIFVVIILAFPFIVYIQESLLSTIVSNLKTERIETLSYKFYFPIEKTPEQLKITYMCDLLINSLIETPDYPVKVQRIGPTIVATITFILHVVNLLNQYPELKEFLVNRFF